jgi:ABC-type glycerol-3-phosphate transport system substrate-binding protein
MDIDMAAEQFLIPLLLGSLKATGIVIAVFVILRIWRGGSAATRHWVWVLALTGTLLIPILAEIGPQWILPLLPANPNVYSLKTYLSDSAATPVVRIGEDSKNVMPFIPAPDALAPQTPKLNSPSPSKVSPIPPQANSRPTPQLPRLSQILVLIWVLGTLAVFLTALRQYWRVWRITKYAVATEIPTALIAACPAPLRRPIRVLESPQVQVPMTWGWFKPVILLPRGAGRWATERQRVVLLHEIAHIARADYLAGWLAIAACAFHWFNPLVWRAAHDAAIERERASDDRVLLSGVKGSQYAGHLLDVAYGLRGRPAALSGALAMARRSDLEIRIISVLNHYQRRNATPLARRFLLGVCAILLAIPLSTVRVSRAAPDTIVLSIAVRPVFAEAFTPDMLKAFEDAHPGVIVNIVKDAPCCTNAVDGLSTHFDRLTQYANSADILYVGDKRISNEGTRAGYFLDLTPYIAADPALNPDDFYPAAWTAYQWDHGIWGLPVSIEPWVLGYQRDAFDRAGIAYPDSHWTLADFGKAATALTQKRADGSIVAAGANIDEPSFLWRSLSNNALVDSDNSGPHFATPELSGVLDSWLSLDTAGAVSTQFVDRPPMGLTLIGDVIHSTRDPQRQTYGALLPGGKTIAYVPGFAISAGTAHPDLAYQLLSWLTTRPDFDSAFALLPARRSLGNASAIQLKGDSLDPATQTLLNDALDTMLSPSEFRFTPYIMSAYGHMHTDHATSTDALQNAEASAVKALNDSTARRATTKLSVLEAGAPAPLPAGKVAIKFLISTPHVAGKLPNQDSWDKVAADFAANDPQVGRVTFDNSPDDDLARFALSEDCFFVPENGVAAVPAGTLVNLDPYMTADAAFDKADFLGSSLAAVQFDHKTYAYPLGIEPMVLQLSLDQLTRAGLTLPSANWTVSDFVDMLHRLKTDTSDPAPFDTSRADGTHLLALIASFGGLPIDYRTTPPTIAFTDAATAAAIKQTLDLARGGYLTYTHLGNMPPNPPMPGPTTAPIYSDVLNDLSAVVSLKTGSSGKYQAVLYPEGSQYTGIAYNIEAGYISGKSQYPEACYRWLSVLAQHPELFEAMPARHSQINTTALKGTVNPTVMALYTQFDALLHDPHTVAFPMPSQGTSPSDYLIRYWLYQAFDDYVLNGKDLDSALKDAEGYAKSYQTCANTLPTISIVSGTEALRPFVNCAEAADPRLKPILDPVINGSSGH